MARTRSWWRWISQDWTAADPAFGSQALWTDAPARALPRARSAADVLRWVDGLKLLAPDQYDTWDDAIAAPVRPGARPARSVIPAS